MVDRNVGGYHVPDSEAGTMRAAEVERRMAQEQARQQDAQRHADDAMWRSMGSNQSRSVPIPTSSKPGRPPTGKRVNKAKPAENEFSGLFAIIGFVLAVGYLGNDGKEGWELFIGSCIAGVLAGALYKVILAIVGIAVAALIFSTISEASTADFAGTYQTTFQIPRIRGGAATGVAPFQIGEQVAIIFRNDARLCVNGTLLAADPSQQLVWIDPGTGIEYQLPAPIVEATAFTLQMTIASTGAAVGNLQGSGTRSSTATNCAGLADDSTPPPTDNDIMDEIFSLAESKLADLFPGGVITQTQEQYTFRFYPASGIYLAFADGEVLITGGRFGEKVTVAGAFEAVLLHLRGPQVSPAMVEIFQQAEQQFPELFPAGAQTVALGNEVYRFYNNTGIKLTFRNGNVFVRGGTFGPNDENIGDINRILRVLQRSRSTVTPTASAGGNYSLTIANYETDSSDGGTRRKTRTEQDFATILVDDTAAPDFQNSSSLQDEVKQRLRGQFSNINGIEISVDSNAEQRKVFIASFNATANGVSNDYQLSFDYRLGCSDSQRTRQTRSRTSTCTN